MTIDRQKNRIYEYVLVACARWERAYILEWTEYHRAIGFDHLYLYCNDDDPQELYNELLPFIVGDDPFVTFVHFPYQGHQNRMYLHYLQNYKNQTAWATFLDIDEFLWIGKSTTISKFHEEFTQFDELRFNWCFFGNNGFVERPSGSVLLQYTKRAEHLHPLTKNIFRTSAIPESWTHSSQHDAFWHSWHSTGLPMKSVNVLGDDREDYYFDFPNSASKYLNSITEQIINKAFIAHFAFKSEDDFRLRVERGLQGNFAGQAMWGRRHEDNTVKSFLFHLNNVVDERLREFWLDVLAGAKKSTLVSNSNWNNISDGKRATQSSLSQWSKGKNLEEDAAGALSGIITGNYQFHTEKEDSPWWEVDLCGSFLLHEIRIFNRLDMCSDKFQKFKVFGFFNCDKFLIYEKNDKTPIGGVDCNPFVYVLRTPVPVFKIRIVLTGNDYLHLDQVQIFGVQIPAA